MVIVQNSAATVINTHAGNVVDVKLCDENGSVFIEKIDSTSLLPIGTGVAAKKRLSTVVKEQIDQEALKVIKQVVSDQTSGQ